MDLFYLSGVLAFLGCYLVLIFQSVASFLQLNLDGKSCFVFMPKLHRIIVDYGELWMYVSKNNYFQVFIHMRFRGLTQYKFLQIYLWYSLAMVSIGFKVSYVLILEKSAFFLFFFFFCLYDVYMVFN